MNDNAAFALAEIATGAACLLSYTYTRSGWRPWHQLSQLERNTLNYAHYALLEEL